VTEEHERTTPTPLSMDGVKVEEFLNHGRNVWIVRAVGAGLLIAAWVYFAVPHFGSARFVADSLVFAGLAAYTVIAGFNARRHTMELEKKLRLTLIMRNMELEGQATRDPLTHLFNRRHFFERLERELQNARGFQRPLSILMIDVNGMNEINSTHGHRVGDLVLASFGKFLLDQARASDLPARIGGDEFAVILPDTTEQATQSAINRLLAALEKTAILETNDGEIKLRAAIGAAGYPWSADSEDELIKQAWAAMVAHRRSQEVQPVTNGVSAPTGTSAAPSEPTTS
jgi:diguanylate cyclase (GGDEF)-like protein